MCKENVNPKDLENQVMPTSAEDNTEGGNSGNGNNNSGNGGNNVGNTGQSGSSGDGSPVRPQPNWGVGGLSLDNPEENN